MSIKGVVITDAPKIESCVVNHYKCLFKIPTILQENGLVEETIPTSILDLLSNIEIKDAMWSLNRDNASGPDGFGENYCQIFGHHSQDVINVVTQFFQDD